MSIWLKNYIQNINLKNTIIVQGNINDYSVNRDGKYEKINSILLQELYEKRDKIITYDTINGISFENLSQSEIYEILRKTSVSEKYNFNGEKIILTGRLGRSRGFSEDNNEISVTQSDALDEIKSHFKIPNNFLEFVYATTKTELEVSYFIKLGDSIFGKLNQGEVLDDIQKCMLSNLSEATEKLNMSNVKRNIVISLKTISHFPSIFHINNIKLGKVSIPLPDRLEREEYFSKNYDKFNIDLKDSNDFIDALDGVTLVEMEQLGNLSKLEENIGKDYKEIISLFRFGNLDNPWNKLRKEKISNILQEMGKRVKGQDDAIRKVKEIIMKAYTGLSGIQHSSKKMKPKGILFLVGPTGVGKTELAKTLAEFVFGDEIACIRFDMSEFNSEHSDQRLIGAPPGYVGHENGGELTNKVKERPFSLLLFDEIEKAHNKILDKFLQILEDGRLTDGKGETVYFSDCIIIFTSNIGTKDITINDENSKELFKNEVIKFFKLELGRPEILNRIGVDNIIPFDFIRDNNFLKEIVLSKLKNIDDYLKNKYSTNIEYVNKDGIFLRLVEKIDKSNGGREALNKMEDYLINPLSEFLFLNDNFVKNKTIVAEYDEYAECFIFSVK